MTNEPRGEARAFEEDGVGVDLAELHGICLLREVAITVVGLRRGFAVTELPASAVRTTDPEQECFDLHVVLSKLTHMN